MGEMSINGSAGFKLVNAATVHTGSLVALKETGYVYSPQPYQQVFEADFPSFTTPGECQLVDPGYGASQAEIPSPQLSYSFIYTTIAGNLPAGGQWVKLEVPANAVGLEGSKIHGMSFSAFGGRVPRDATGKTSPAN